MSGSVLGPGDSDTKEESLRSLRDHLLRRKLVFENNQFWYSMVDAEGLRAGSRDNSGKGGRGCQDRLRAERHLVLVLKDEEQCV